jgi:DnaJ like chaperone protein
MLLDLLNPPIAGNAASWLRTLVQSGAARRKAEAEEARHLLLAASVVGLAARLGAADGRLNRAEIQAFRELFPLNRWTGAECARLLILAEKDESPLAVFARKFLHGTEHSAPAAEELLERLFHLAVADSDLTNAEWDFLRQLAAELGIKEAVLQKIARKFYIPSTSSNPYELLGVTKNASNEELRRAYHRLVREYHPDGLEAYGLPAVTIAAAQEKLTLINAAYETIRRKRGLK